MNMERAAVLDAFTGQNRRSESMILDEIVPRLSLDMPQKGIAAIGSNGRDWLSPIAPEGTPTTPMLLNNQNQITKEILSIPREGGDGFSCPFPETGHQGNCRQHSSEVRRVSYEQLSDNCDHDRPNLEVPGSDDALILSTSEDGIRYRSDIEAAQNLISVSSREFIEQLRGAAFRRKALLARSRDSLVAKEKEQRETIAASKEAASFRSQTAKYEMNKENSSEYSVPSFKARPIPFSLTATGVSGVPKVEKRPSTIPRSPMIGKRRSASNAAGSNDQATGALLKDIEQPNLNARLLPRGRRISGYGGKCGAVKVEKKITRLSSYPTNESRISILVGSQQTSHPDTATFKARPLPRTNGDFGHGGLAGVIKVPKRPVTTAVSPMLGARRSKPPQLDSAKSCKIASECSLGQLSSSDLIGVNLVNSSSEQSSPPKTPQRADARPWEFVPHSTLRAQKRAEFEVTRRINELERERQESLQRQKQVRALDKELSSLREQI